MKRSVRVATVLPVLLVASVLGTSEPAVASNTDQAFNSSTGGINVDRASYLAKHDVVYNGPNANPNYGLTVGNGKVGAMVWNVPGGLNMQVSNVDGAQQSSFAAGNATLTSSPGFDSGYSTYQQRLNLYDGTLTTKYDANRTITIMGNPNSEVLGINVQDSRAGVSSIAFDLSLWDLASLGNSGGVPDINTWKTVSTFADAAGIGISRGQTDANQFGYTMAATVEGAGYSSQTVNGSRVRLNITPSANYTIWIAVASRLNAPGNNSVTQARNLLAGAKTTGYTTTLNTYRNWWHSFWDKSFVQYSGSGDADYIENMYYLSTYMTAAGGYGNYPFHFINGVFRATGDNTKWSNGYWYWNQRDVYNSFYASNHPDLLAGFNRLYSRNYNALKSLTQSRFGIDGIRVPESMGWDGHARGETDYTTDTMSTGVEAAYNMYLYYRYTNDANYLSSTAYPFMREVVKFYAARLSFNSSTGKYFMASSNAHETYWDVQNAITDLAAVRLMFPIAIATSSQLGLDAGARAQWQNVVDNLVANSVVNGQYQPHQPPIAATHNNENVASELIWPYDQTGIGSADYQNALNTFNARPFPYGNVWAPDPIQAARLGLGDATLAGMKRMLQQYQNYPNGFTSNTNGVFEYGGVNLTALNESLLQSYNDKIRVFPAAPGGSFAGTFTLMAKDGFQVSSEREAGETKYVGIKSLFGKTARVVNPWGTQAVRVRRTSDNAIITTTTAGEFTFATSAGAVYVVERTAKLLSAYSATTLTGSANNGVKSLSGTSSTLGLGTGGAGDGSVTRPTFYADTEFGGTAVGLNAGTYTTAQMVGAGVPNNWVSSLKVPAGWTVVAYDGDLAGTSWTYTANAGNLVSAGNNDMISSLRITQGGGGSGPVISLRARVNGKYVQAQNAGAGALLANATAIGQWEQFERLDAGGGNIALRSKANNLIVAADNAGANPLIAKNTAIGSWETFQLVTNANGSVSLRAVVNNRYVTAENAGASALIANRTSIGLWEEFDLITG
ncbi:MAG: hypothetical protein JWM93_612 [Frankiales bacterium]|nr:hypothetical protein [Frankiales bacterium]